MYKSRDHLTFLIFARLSGIGSARDLKAARDGNTNLHHHLGGVTFARSKVFYANATRSLGAFKEAFSMLLGMADRENEAMLLLIDFMPVRPGRVIAWAKTNGRIMVWKLYDVCDPAPDTPTRAKITDASVNDVTIGEQCPTLLLRLAPIICFAGLIAVRIFTCAVEPNIHKPPNANPASTKPKRAIGPLEFRYA